MSPYKSMFCFHEYLIFTQIYFDIDGNSKITLSDVLIFATGASRIPPMGFCPEPSLSFWEHARPKANTCANVLYLPTATEVENFNKFQEMMEEAVMNSPSFGLP